ncbi:LexA-binding, inner membrane-associated putative hydrolase [Desulfotomaculum arcticum]|uniref:LexA-binding, inner membrane-associated putative hydrolase n=1 Tax=Desulfotruncus arcticus DSM 17038 TaxID=1121424 RepID=A0A1I2Q2C7_9FIRM|nr:metal-dependent hydrolase [Desulfotruncus arcticus]SFG22655.1 LexA-binding, inner membrane-associated putative hydrolase [Desulfotomaculum arcticum] [Desulfotruncus arcticus DSM 17038]
MLLLAHVGITLGIAKGIKKTMKYRGNELAENIDYRLVILGAMLPDIIDKPLGGVIFKETIGNGRIYSHTLLFLLFLLAVAAYFWSKYRKIGMLVVAGGCIVHHILDGMWLYPGTFLWPANGWAFPKGNPENWLQLWLNLLTEPRYLLPEVIGGIIMLCFVKNIVSWRQFVKFIANGR